MSHLEDLGLVPLPRQIQARPGRCTITPNTRLILANTKITSEQVRAILPNLPVRPAGEPASVPENSILLTTNSADPELGSEGYRLEIALQGAVLAASAASGFLYGLQTLRQMLWANAPEQSCGDHTCHLPCCVIRDRPRFSWRGMHLDVSRHFFPGEQIRRFLDLMALHKFNTFHWHLTDDQGWRIEIEKWPRLTSVGAWRGQGSERYGGFYSKRELSEIVRYATDRGITIVPEIELPGHAQAAIAAYPWLGNTGAELPVRRGWGSSPHIFAVSDRTLAFLEDCLYEVREIFPGPYIHIGGDECCKDEWRASSQAQERIHRERLRDENELQTWFVNRICTFLAHRGRRAIGWDEIRNDGLCADTSIMVWRGAKHAQAALRAGHDVVMTPTSHCYLDYYQGNRSEEPQAFDGNLPLRTVYDFDPILKSLTPSETQRVLGSQGILWTEHIADWDHLMYMAFPRACAMAEVLWSPPEARNFDHFKARLQRHVRRLSAQGVNHRPVTWNRPQQLGPDC